jgi:hypothetical protein
MKKFKLLPLFSVFAIGVVMAAQVNVPAGKIIPVQLKSSLDAKKCKPGQVVKAEVAQDVQLDKGATIKAGTRVSGEVLAVIPAVHSQPATIAFRFDKIDILGQTMPITTDLRALASPLEVEAAQLQISGDDRGTTPPWSQTVTLVGGDDAVNRESGTVKSGLETVGTSVYGGNWGVMSQIASTPGEKCRGAFGGNDKLQALWVFSHDACGAYGVEAVVTHAGRSNPEGRIELASTNGDLILRSGSALLLRVNRDSGVNNASLQEVSRRMQTRINDSEKLTEALQTRY